MERIKNLSRYQKGILILLLTMVLVFGVLYSSVTSRYGFLYNDKIFSVSEENGTTVYSGKIGGEDCRFSVTSEKSITFQYGESLYGPYTVKEDPTAIPDDHNWFGEMIGIEVCDKGAAIFRGGILNWGNPGGIWLLVNEDGSDASISFTVTASDGTILDGNGNIVDPLEPSVTSILELAYGPTLTHKGNWEIWFYGTIISVITAVSILFADEIFRWNLAFQIRNADHAEPSDWEISTRYIGWTVMPILALVIYIIGLQ